jgi:nucleoside-diphosphate-sugar epimerase
VAQQCIAFGRVAQAIASHFGGPKRLIVLDIADVVAEFGGWATGAALDQQMSAQKLCDAVGWRPKHTYFEDVSVFI